MPSKKKRVAQAIGIATITGTIFSVGSVAPYTLPIVAFAGLQFRGKKDQKKKRKRK